MKQLIVLLAGWFITNTLYGQIAVPVCYDKVIEVSKMGGKGDGINNDQEAIQNSIDKASVEGGGIVHFHQGEWLAPKIELKDNVVLQFDQGCVISGEIDVKNVKNVGIIGDEVAKVYLDTRVNLENSQNIILKNIFTRHGWWINYCEKIQIENVKLEQLMVRHANGLYVPGITFTGCKDVYGVNLNLTSNDDNWCIKRYADNIHLVNSVVCSRLAACFKIGTESDGKMENISVTNCMFYNSTRAGINIESVDGADINNLTFSDIRMYEVAAPFFINIGYRDRYGKGVIGTIKNITFNNIEYVGMRNDDGIGSSIIGLPGHPIENITINNVHFTYKGGHDKETALREVPELRRLYPEFDNFGVLPAYGLYARHVKGLKLKDITVGIANPDLRSALICEDVEELNIDRFIPQTYIAVNQFNPAFKEDGSMLLDLGIKDESLYKDESVSSSIKSNDIERKGLGHDDLVKGQQLGSRKKYIPPWGKFQEPESSIKLNQVKDAIIRNCQTPVNTAFVEIKGDKTNNITFIDNDITHCSLIPYNIGNEVNGQLVLSPIATPKYDDLIIPEVQAGKPTLVTVRMINAGNYGYAKVELLVNNETVNRKWVFLGKNDFYSCEIMMPPYYKAEVIEVSVGSLNKQIKVIPAEAKLECTELTLPTKSMIGQVPVSVSVKNIGSSKIVEPLVLMINGGKTSFQEINLEPGEEKAIGVDVIFDKSGIFEVEAYGKKSNISINPIWIDKNGNNKMDSDENNFYSFKEAIAEATEGDVILVNPCIYLIKANKLPIHVNKKNITIKSAEGIEKTMICTDVADQNKGKQHSLFYITADGVKIEGLTLSAAWVNIYIEKANNCIVNNNYFDFTKRHHVFLDSASNCVIKNNRSRAALYNFLGMKNCNNCIIEDNYHHEDPCGIYAENCHNNIFRRNHYDGLAWFGITFHSSTNNIIEDNLFNDGRLNGLQFRSGSNNNKVTKNTFLNNKTEAILWDGGSKDNQITQNNIVGNKGLALANETPFTVDARNNWWGSVDGPSGAGNGSGDAVDKRMNFKPWLKTPVKNKWK